MGHRVKVVVFLGVNWYALQAVDGLHSCNTAHQIWVVDGGCILLLFDTLQGNALGGQSRMFVSWKLPSLVLFSWNPPKKLTSCTFFRDSHCAGTCSDLLDLQMFRAPVYRLGQDVRWWGPTRQRKGQAERKRWRRWKRQGRKRWKAWRRRNQRESFASSAKVSARDPRQIPAFWCRSNAESQNGIGDCHLKRVVNSRSCLFVSGLMRRSLLTWKVWNAKSSDDLYNTWLTGPSVCTFHLVLSLATMDAWSLFDNHDKPLRTILLLGQWLTF